MSETHNSTNPSAKRPANSDNTDSRWKDASPVELSEALKTVLLLDSAPVGVQIFSSAEEFDSCEFNTPQMPLYYCSAVKMASEGSALKLSLRDISCDTSPRTLGLEPGFHDDDFIETYVAGGLYENIEVAKDVLSDVVALDDMAGVAVGPLDAFSTENPPDVVIACVLPYAAMRISQAANYSGNKVNSAAIGMHGICSESTATPFKTNEITTSLLCSGTRYVAGWDDQLMSAGIPFGLLGTLVDGLMRTAERYETDERKGEMRTSCRCVLPCSDKVAEEVTHLSEHAGYFYKE